MSGYTIILVWVLIFLSLGIYWHVMRINQKMGKFLDAMKKGDGGSGE